MTKRRLYKLCEEPFFPPPHLAGADGLLAIGGDLRPERLINAYAAGVFPWYSDGEPLLWWSPDPRCLILPGELHVSRSMERELRKGSYRVTADQAFSEVIRACAGSRRPGQRGTWITREMIEAYERLHTLGFAHSFECWTEDGILAGGLYGVSLGRFFAGESMFSRQANASKVALHALYSRMMAWGFAFIDCQMPTPHLLSLGARTVSRGRYLRMLDEAVKGETKRGRWFDPAQGDGVETGAD